MDINPSDSETTIVVFEDDGLECNGNVMSQIEYTTDKGSTKTISEETNGTFLVPETFMAQNSVLGQDFVIRCTPCNKIFVSADGYNRHVQVRRINGFSSNSFIIYESLGNSIHNANKMDLMRLMIAE